MTLIWYIIFYYIVLLHGLDVVYYIVLYRIITCL